MLNYNTELEKIFNSDCSIPSSREDILSRNTVLYGAGSLGTMAVDLMNKKGLYPQYVIDKSRNGTVGTIKIVKPEEITLNDKENFLFLICISTLPYNDIATYLKALGCRHFMHFYTWAYLIMPELLENGWFKADMTESDKKEILSVCKMLAHNELSLAHYLQFLWWKLRLKEIICEGYPVLTGKKYFKSPVFPALGEHEVLLDGGAHFGQTIEAFIEKTKDNYDKIYAFEPDKRNLQTAQEKFKDWRIIYSNSALYDKSTTLAFKDGLGFASKISADGSQKVQAVRIDDLDIQPTIIKLHIEGDELRALKGAEKTIKKCHPVLMILADHSEDGLYKIPQFINKLGGYKLYFNLHDYCGNTAVFYGTTM